MKDRVHESVTNILENVPKIDIHTHLQPSRLMARGLDDILLYHMVNSELYSSGYPYGERVPEDRDESLAVTRLEKALPYLREIRNTSLYRMLKMILKDMYGWKAEITPTNWKTLHDMIKERHDESPDRARKILRGLNIKKTGTEYARRGDGEGDDVFQYALEWAFFARSQWGQPDSPLFELERAWNSDAPQLPVPVTMKKEERPVLETTINNAADIRKAIQHYCDRIPFDELTATTQHISTDITYSTYSDEEINQAIEARESAGLHEQSVYASAILTSFLDELQSREIKTVFQFSIGAEPLPYESGSWLHQQTIKDLSLMLHDYPKVHFMCFNASRHAHQSFCTLVREYQNFSLAGFWWHSFFPSIIENHIKERFDMVPLNKQCGFFTDAYCVDWVYGKTKLLLEAYASVFSEMVRKNRYSLSDVEYISQKIFFDTPVSLLGFHPND
jgi:hypothetical protein